MKCDLKTDPNLKPGSRTRGFRIWSGKDRSFVSRRCDSGRESDRCGVARCGLRCVGAAGVCWGRKMGVVCAEDVRCTVEAGRGEKEGRD